MASVIKVNAGEFAAAVKFSAGRINKERKTPFPLLIEEQTEGRITFTDAAFQKKVWMSHLMVFSMLVLKSMVGSF